MRTSFTLQDMQEHLVEAGVTTYGVNLQVEEEQGSLPDVFAAVLAGATKMALIQTA